MRCYRSEVGGIATCLSVPTPTATIKLPLAELKKDMTRLIVIHSDNKRKVDLVRTTFPEIAGWRPDPTKDFTYATMMRDKRVLIVVNLVSSTFEKQLETKIELQ